VTASKLTLPAVNFNYFGSAAADGSEAGAAPAFGTAPETYELPPTLTGRMVSPAELSVNAAVNVVDGVRKLQARFTFPEAVLDETTVDDLAHRWIEILDDLVDFVAAGGDPGRSPSDFLASDLTQREIDEIIARYGEYQIWPLSPLQRGLYFQAELMAEGDGGTPESADVYVTQAMLKLDGPIDVDRLHTAADQLLATHAILRSAYVRTAAGSVVAAVPSVVRPAWTEVHLDDRVAGNADDRVAELATRELRVPFDMSTPGLMRFLLVRTGIDEHVLIITNHHILLDGTRMLPDTRSSSHGSGGATTLRPSLPGNVFSHRSRDRRWSRRTHRPTAPSRPITWSRSTPNSWRGSPLLPGNTMSRCR